MNWDRFVSKSQFLDEIYTFSSISCILQKVSCITELCYGDNKKIKILRSCVFYFEF
jgi:hypothetical protein